MEREVMIHFFLRISIPVFFGLATWQYWIYFKDQQPENKKRARLFYGSGLFLLTLLLFIFAVDLNHIPIAGPFQAVAVFMWFFAILNRIVIIKDRSYSLGVFHSGILFLLLTISMIFIKNIQTLPSILQNVYFEIHVVLNLIGYAALSLSFIASLMYELLYHEIKSTRLGFFYERLPALSYLERQFTNSFIIGFVFFTVGIIVAVFTGKVVWGVYWLWDPKIVSAAITWLIYAFMTFSKYRLNWQGNRLAVLSLSGYGWILFSILIINTVFTNIHTFR